MGKPAARLGDPTAHGGTIVVGFPMVLIGGMPAARVGDMHVCPMLNPGVPPPPHVGGPIAMGSPMVLIGGMPAARLGDMVTCAGPPDTIMMGCPTVLIGEGGSGSASGGGSGSSGSSSAATSATTALSDNVEATTKEKNWIEFEFVDKVGNAVSSVPYKFKDSINKDSNSKIRIDGKIRRDALQEGECQVQLYLVSNAKWSKEKANIGEKVKLTADVEGFEDGTIVTIEIYCRDINSSDSIIDTIETEVKNSKIEVEWEYVYSEDANNEGNNSQLSNGYTYPRYYFTVVVENSKSRSGILEYKDYLVIELKGPKGQGIPNEEYILYLANGEVRSGKLDKNGKKREENVPPCAWDILFPNLTGAYEES